MRLTPARPKTQTRAQPASRRKSATKRLPAKERRMLPWGRIAAFLAVIALGGGLYGWWVSDLGTRQREDWAFRFYEESAQAGLAVKDVLVLGRKRSEGDAILAALDIGRGSPILAFDPHQARDRVLDIPWVKSAKVERRLPNTVYVELVERQPLAIWQLRGKLQVIDQEGEIIENAKAERFADLPQVVGEGAPEKTQELLEMLALEPDAASLVAFAVRVGNRRWNLRLRGGTELQLPETEPAEAWSQFARLERDHGLLDRDVIVIDLRLPDRMVVRSHKDQPVEQERAIKTSDQKT